MEYLRKSESIKDRVKGWGTRHTPFRQLSTTQGRWLSPDPYVGSVDLTNPQSLNRYAYVGNNPMNAVDPLGLYEAGCDDPLFAPFHPLACGDGGGGGGGGGGPACDISDPWDCPVLPPIGGGGHGGGGSGGGRTPTTEPTVNPSGAPLLSGETLGLPNGMSIQQRSLLAALGVPLPPDCGSGGCVIINLIGTGVARGSLPAVDANLAFWIARLAASLAPKDAADRVTSNEWTCVSSKMITGTHLCAYVCNAWWDPTRMGIAWPSKDQIKKACPNSKVACPYSLAIDTGGRFDNLNFEKDSPPVVQNSCIDKPTKN